LIMWLKPSSSIAMEDIIWFMASPRESGGEIVGNSGNDIIIDHLS